MDVRFSFDHESRGSSLNAFNHVPQKGLVRGPDLAGVFKVRLHKVYVKLAYHSRLCLISASPFN